jgi:hypothetical protein
MVNQFNIEEVINMINLAVEDSQFKVIMKQVLIELVEERRELFKEIFEEVIEEIGLIKAIPEAELSEEVSRAEIFKQLNG